MALLSAKQGSICRLNACKFNSSGSSVLPQSSPAPEVSECAAHTSTERSRSAGAPRRRRVLSRVGHSQSSKPQNGITRVQQCSPSAMQTVDASTDPLQGRHEDVWRRLAVHTAGEQPLEHGPADSPERRSVPPRHRSRKLCAACNGRLCSADRKHPQGRCAMLRQRMLRMLCCQHA